MEKCKPAGSFYRDHSRCIIRLFSISHRFSVDTIVNNSLQKPVTKKFVKSH